MSRQSYFEVDIDGMRAEALERGWGPLLTELLSNAFDEPITLAKMSVEPAPWRGQYLVRIEDDSPSGFRKLTDAFTMFARSYKRNNPEQRGRFNMGEKWVISACEWAEIISTTGGYRFDRKTRERTTLRRRRLTGTLFDAVIRSNQDEVAAALDWLGLILPPEGKAFILNGKLIPYREPLLTVEETLPTLYEDEDGQLRPTARKTLVHVYQPALGEVPMIFEMGIPVCELDEGSLHVNVQQKVPLNQERNNVSAWYRRAIRVVAFNAAAQVGVLTEEMSRSVWVKDAASDDRASPEAITTRLDLQFGKNRVAYDPSDAEANNRAVAEGDTLIWGNQLSKQEWRQAQRAGAYQPAGQKYPTKFWGYSDDPDALPEKLIPESEWTFGMRRMAVHARWLFRQLVADYPLQISFADEPIARKGIQAAYSPDAGLIYNVGILKKSWFDRELSDPVVNTLHIHEFAHHWISNHLSAEFAEAIAKIGARMVVLALEHPEYFRPTISFTTDPPAKIDFELTESHLARP